MATREILVSVFVILCALPKVSTLPVVEQGASRVSKDVLRENEANVLRGNRDGRVFGGNGHGTAIETYTQTYLFTTKNVILDKSKTTEMDSSNAQGIMNLRHDSNHKLNKTIPRTDNVLPRMIPREWEDFCLWDFQKIGGEYFSRRSTVYIQCRLISKDHIWNFDSFRTFIKPLQDNRDTTRYAIDVVCEQGLSIVLPWPMKAYNLWFLSVRSCDIYNFMTEFSRQDLGNIEDYLNVLDIADTSIYVSFAELLAVMTTFQTVSSWVECGSQKLEHFVFRNVTREITGVEVVKQTDEDKEEFTEAVGDFHRQSRILDHVCKYQILKAVDESIAEVMASHHMEVFSSNSRFPELTMYNLSDTRLPKIAAKFADWRLTFPKMEYLDLSHNNISSFAIVDHGKFSSQPGHIDLRFNNITTITEKELKQLKQLETVILKLEDNPFHCDCNIRYFVEFLQDNTNLSAIGLANYEYFKTLNCKTPTTLKGRVIASLSVSEIGCYDVRSTIEKSPFIAMCIVVAIFIITVVLLIKFRKEIIILAYTRLNVGIPCQKQYLIGNKLYDGFISYSTEDSKWVVETLLPRLERPERGQKFKLCIHQRDFEVGTAIADNIVKSIETSRHTVLILSTHFLESEWCLLEFRTALHQGLLEKSRHLIMVILDDFSTEKIESDLKRCMQTLTYVRADDTLFWDKLVYSLSDNRRANTKTKSILKNVFGKVPIGSINKGYEPDNGDGI